MKTTLLQSFFTFSKSLLINLEMLNVFSKSVLDCIYQMQSKSEMFPHGFIKFICNYFLNLFVEICTTFQSKVKLAEIAKYTVVGKSTFL